MANISVSLPDGTQREIQDGATAADLASDIGKGLFKAALIAEVNGEEADLNKVLPNGATVNIVTADSDKGLETLRHSTAHVLAQAVLELYPGATFAIGPPIEHGFYYDFAMPEGKKLSDESLQEIEDKMKEIIAADQDFIRGEVSAGEALEMFSDHPYKCEIIEAADSTEVSAPDAISYYRNGDGFIDLCRGPHVPSTGKLQHFKLMNVAGAYWRGDEKNPMLQRIYGTAWATKKQLKEHLYRLEEAAKRDHRKLANELDLLSFPSELGGGLAVWHPKGSQIRKLMEDYSRKRHEEGGYKFVYSPHIANAELFRTSGHLDFYAEGMYPPMEMDNGEYYPKPMNCPMHCLIYRAGTKSYRDLPIRLFELGTVYRYERAGTLHGLMRIRGFTQDDAHIFTTEEGLAEEIAQLLEFVISVLEAFGFEDFSFNLSTRDHEKSVGDDQMWNLATEALEKALNAHGLPFETKEGDAAFYGPKIDIDVSDAIGRSWQLSTIQLDFNLPERFNLRYINSSGERKRPVMIHRALMGSIERFFGVLLEHYAGAFPAWLAPIQIAVLPVASEHGDYASSIVAQLEDAGFRCEYHRADNPLGKRIRDVKTQKIPYVLVAGSDDVANGTVGVNPRGSEVERDVPVSKFIERLQGEVENRL
ncbi:MAG: threonine--tRNA ligase [Acidimicrobiaceae bacterium]|jgi:threonyl-tRNA synthetase|nr:threonine--tRNA ligase [Acidimicrobiaceae bacterium]HAY51325.1 threonine--tRNA ligase [Acidimicrobiaceae bacterium]|tara:strand:+ start:9534 stop:11474 length:1941 start_codon:yes stop_codon:yes gene_type:complete